MGSASLYPKADDTLAAPERAMLADGLVARYCCSFMGAVRSMLTGLGKAVVEPGVWGCWALA